MRELNKKQRIFAEEYVKNGYKARKAYLFAYGVKDPQVASVGASQLLRKTNIIEAIDEIEGDFSMLSREVGLDKKTVLKVVKKMIDAEKEGKNGYVEDYAARKDAITLYAKLIGAFKDKKEIAVTTKDVTDVDPTNMNKEDIKKLEEELLDEL